MNDNRKTLIAAAIIFSGFLLFAYFLPAIMMAAVDLSPWVAGLVALVFIFAFFGIFWLRGRSQSGK